MLRNLSVLQLFVMRSVSSTKEIKDKKENWHDMAGKSHDEVTPADIADIVSSWTGVPVTQLSTEESDRLLHMEDELHRRIVGQDEAVEAVSRAIRRGRVGLKDPKKPIGSFIFFRPHGRRQNRALQGSGRRYVR